MPGTPITQQPSCMQCHGGVALDGQVANAAPPRDVHGGTITTALGVGAHQKHLQLGSAIRAPIACEECHVVPAQVAGHFGKPRARLTFGPLAARGGAPAWDFATATCSNVYCHGDTINHGGGATKPVWTRVDGTQATCASCHGFPPAAPHPANATCNACHPDTVKVDGSIDIAGGKHINGVPDVAGNLACNTCHGNLAGDPANLVNVAPPRDTSGGTRTTLVTVGAHQAHLKDGALRLAVACTECHVVPAQVAGHNAGPTATLTFGPLSTTGGLSPAWTRGSATCASTYCHGASLSGGSVAAPLWTRSDGTERACGACHGAPPPAPHPFVDVSGGMKACAACHAETVDAASGAILVAGGKHINGTVDFPANLACNVCHGNAAGDPANLLSAAPPKDTLGRTATSAVTVGAHQAHLVGGPVRGPIACAECHVVPTVVTGHNTGPTATLTFGALATTGGLLPSWTRASATCASTYCHGASLSGGSAVAPVWTTVDGSQQACGSCHGAPPPAPHPFVNLATGMRACATCHPQTVDAATGAILLAGGKHIDGTLDVAATLACNACHGSAQNAAPPTDTRGNAATSFVTVGAHQRHLAGGTVRGPIACTDCHVVPSVVGNHNAGPTATLTWSTLATGSGALAPSWDRASATCASTYCHGGTLAGGAVTLPIWTRLDGTQVACDACHGAPPPSPHPASLPAGDMRACATCHPATVSGTTGGILLAGNRHIDGAVDVANLACNTCHGNATNNAPPKDTLGRTATTNVTVGAHQAHLTDSSIRFALSCDECHVVPAVLGTHNTGPTATLTFGPLAAKAGTPTWDRTSATCSGAYCHTAGGLTVSFGGASTRPVWTKVDGSQRTCGSCHGFPPPAPHPQPTVAQPTLQCSDCHPATVRPDFSIDVAGGHHIDGRLDVSGAGACNGCHDAPPATGAHLAHAIPPALGDVAYGDQSVTEQVDPAGATGNYYFGCGMCHPTDPALHFNGTVNVDLSAATGAPGGLKSRNSALAAYDGVAKTCSGVACHSSGQAVSPAYVTTPGWSSGATLGCGGCHGNPPSYPNGGPGSATANTHIGLDVKGWEYGHVFGLPGSAHGSKHGQPTAFMQPTAGLPSDQRAAPVTCQACHADTVDPSNVAPNGFFYLDTGVTTSLPGGDPTRTTFKNWNDLQCGSCHTGAAGRPPAGAGKVRPLRHVNGKRDVVFDPRTTLPANYLAGPLGAYAPTRPYFLTDFNDLILSGPLPTGAVLDGPPPTAPDFVLDTLSMNLTAARYDSASRTCSSVACHLEQTSVTWGSKAFETPAPGTTDFQPQSCQLCHQ